MNLFVNIVLFSIFAGKSSIATFSMHPMISSKFGEMGKYQWAGKIDTEMKTKRKKS